MNRLARWMGTMVWHWGRAFWSMAVSLWAGVFLFAGPIVESIRSTPHPELVYVIFSVAASAVVLAAYALSRYLWESTLVLRLKACPASERAAMLQSRGQGSDFANVYQLVIAGMGSAASSENMEQKIDAELYAAEEHLLGRLTLSGYLGGALVGVGLVGTFIGLLQSLADLGALFASLMNAGNAAADPVAMFSDMLRRLQEPMKGMGTAFVASLYGLLGSLLMGLVIYGVRKTGSETVSQVRSLLRLISTEPGGVVRSHAEGQVTTSDVNSPLPGLQTVSTLDLHSVSIALKEQTHVQLETAVAIQRLGELIEGRQQAEQAAWQMQQTHLESLVRWDAGLNERTQALTEGFARLMVEQQKVLAHQGWQRRRWALAWLGLWLVLVLSAAMLWRLGQAFREWQDGMAQSLATMRASVVVPSSVGVTVEPNPKPTLPVTTIEVMPGESLSVIASRFGITLGALQRLNPGMDQKEVLHVGQKLRVPARPVGE